jgi:hypothetical protein
MAIEIKEYDGFAVKADNKKKKKEDTTKEKAKQNKERSK